jgi:hypothetical protein
VPKNEGTGKAGATPGGSAGKGKGAPSARTLAKKHIMQGVEKHTKHSRVLGNDEVLHLAVAAGLFNDMVTAEASAEFVDVNGKVVNDNLGIRLTWKA